MTVPALSLPAEAYTTESCHQQDVSQILKHSWQLIGHTSQLTADRSVVELDLLGHPLLLTQDTNRAVHVLHNVCRHRAGPVQPCAENQSRLRCRYHGWTYDLSGQLISAPEMDSTDGFDISDYRLTAIRHDTWNGFVFASLSDQVPPLDDYLAEITEIITPIDLTELNYHHREDYLINCNWKVYMDNYLEGYHIPHIHPELNRMLDYRSYQTVIKPWYSYQFSPLEQADGLYGKGHAYYITLFPNTMLNVYPSRLQTNTVLAVNPNQCRVIFDYYYQAPDLPEMKKMIESDMAFSDLVQKEDIDICEQVQRGLESGVYQPGPLNQKRETGLIHYHDLYHKALDQHQ